MSKITRFRTLARINPSNPVDIAYPLHKNRAAWWIGIPGVYGNGYRVRDIAPRVTPTDAFLTNMSGVSSATNGWRPTSRPGGYGHILFDGSAGYLATTGLFSRLTETWGAWIRPDDFATQGGIGRRIMHDSDASGNNETSLGLGPGGALNWYVYTLNYQFNLSSAAGSMVAGNWYHVCGTRDGSNAYLYINGAQVAFGADGGGFASPTSGSYFSIGTVRYFGGGYFVGAMDDMSIFNRALSPQDVKNWYDLSKAGYPVGMNHLKSPEFAFPDAAPQVPMYFPMTMNSIPVKRRSGGIAY